MKNENRLKENSTHEAIKVRVPFNREDAINEFCNLVQLDCIRDLRDEESSRLSYLYEVLYGEFKTVSKN